MVTVARSDRGTAGQQPHPRHAILQFAHTAMKIVWPGIQSFTGTIGKVCIEMRTLVHN